LLGVPRGKTSVVWFYGFKLHLVVNDEGELLAFCSEYAGKGLKGVVGGNTGWTSVGCSVTGKLGRGAVGTSGNGVAGTLNCGNPLSGDEPAAEW
jgi:hypothetical protein